MKNINRNKLKQNILEECLIDHLAQSDANSSHLTYHEAEGRAMAYVEKHGYDQIMHWMMNIAPSIWGIVRSNIEKKAEEEFKAEIKKREVKIETPRQGSVRTFAYYCDFLSNNKQS